MVSGQDMIVYGVTRHDCTCVRVVQKGGKRGLLLAGMMVVSPEGDV